jgi:hypothetical protein
MPSLRQTTPALAWPALRHAQGRLLGLPFVLAALLPGAICSWQACLAGLAIASLASFVVYVPLTALALNGGGALAEDAPVPPLTRWTYSMLLALWTATAWLGAAVSTSYLR